MFLYREGTRVDTIILCLSPLELTFGRNMCVNIKLKKEVRQK